MGSIPRACCTITACTITVLCPQFSVGCDTTLEIAAVSMHPYSHLHSVKITGSGRVGAPLQQHKGSGSGGGVPTLGQEGLLKQLVDVW